MTTPDQGMPQEAAPTPGSGGGNGIAIAGLVLAIIGLLIFLVPFAGLGVAVVGLVLSIMGMKKAATVGGAGKGAATAGLIIAILGILAGGATTACTVACGAMAGSAVEMQEALEAQAQAEGHATFGEWQAADPEAATRASTEAATKFMGGFGIDMEEMQREIEKAQRQAEGEMEALEGEGEGEAEGAE